ncbi:calcium/sodium antiporter [Gemmatimonadota bacterium]
MGAYLSLDSIPLYANGLVVLLTIAFIGLGAHWVVDAAARVAKRLGISELVIGLTVVALGTSTPEFAVTLIAAFEGHGNISVGNIVGSNIFNLGFILGGCALVRAIPISTTLLWRDGTVLGGATLMLLAIIGWDLRLDRHDGVLLFVLLGVYLGYLFKQRRTGVDDSCEASDHDDQSDGALLRDGALLLVGLVCIIGGSHFLVASATVISRSFGVSEWVVGVTIVAAGTSAPELATSLSGVIKGRYAISAGNLVGSDIFNLLGVLGLAGMVHPVGVDAVARVSLVALCGMVFLVLFFMRTGWRVSRLEGLALVAIAVLRWGFDFSAQAQ